MRREHKLVRLTLEEVQEKKSVEKEIFGFLSKKPSPKDKEIHKLSDDLGVDTDEFEAAVYKLLGDFLGYGKSKDFKGKYNPKELEMGTKVEMEHTSNAIIAKRIAQDHLAEYPDYYTRLAKMEEGAARAHGKSKEKD